MKTNRSAAEGAPRDLNPTPDRPSDGGPRSWFGWLLAGFVLWASIFVARTSIVGWNGRRYFALFDDAMIAMRYAWNLAHGHGLVWNVGERVEGYTSLLMVLVMTPLNAMFGDKRYAVLAVQILGIVTMLAIAYVGRGVFRSLAHRAPSHTLQWLEPIHGAATLGYYPLAYFTLMGMETGLLTLLLMGAVLISLRAADTRSSQDLLGVGALLGLAYLTRPDALIFAALIFAWLVARGRGDVEQGKWAARLAVGVILFMVFPLAQLAFRWSYYGELLPNTYVLKVEGFPLAARIQNGVAYVRPFISDFLPLWLLGGVALVLDFSPKRLLFALLFLSSVAYTVWIGGDAWRNWRLIAPTAPLVLALAVEETARITEAALASRRRAEWRAYVFRNPIWRNALWVRLGGIVQGWMPWLGARLVLGLLLVLIALGADFVGISGRGFGDEQLVLLLLGMGLLASVWIPRFRAASRRPGRASLDRWVVGGALVVALLVANRRFLPEMTFRIPPFDVEWNTIRIELVEALMETTTEEATIGVAAAGVVPYYLGRPAIDFLGKTDAYIAHLPADLSGAMAVGSMRAWPGHNKYDLDYSIGVRRPVYAQLLRWGSDDLCGLLDEVYVSVDFRGARLYLLKNSPDVRWEVVAAEGESPPPEGACSRQDP